MPDEWTWVKLSRHKIAHLVREDEKGRTVLRCGTYPPGKHRHSTHQDLMIKCFLCQEKPAEQHDLFEGVESEDVQTTGHEVPAEDAG